MEFLRNFFGNLSSGVIRLAVTVGILAAVYFFLVKPILHTTEKSVEETNKAVEHSFDKASVDTNGISEKIDEEIENVNKQVQIQVERSFHVAKVHGNPQKLLHCIQRAHQNIHRIERCSRRFS